MDRTQISVSCIIPAHNEAARIGRVLDAVVGHTAVAEVIVIDDASTDGTAEVAGRKGVRLIRCTANGGKAAAVFRGARAAKGSHILMLDADLMGLQSRDITRLIGPVLRGDADATISLRGNSPWIWRAIGVDYISGERVLPAEHLRRAAQLPGFGLEVHLNRIWRAENCRVRVVRCPALSSPAKARKQGLLRGIKADFGMMRDIFRTATLAEVARQILWFGKTAR